MSLECTLFIPDSHHPYQDQKACDLAIKIGKHLKVNRIVTLGDQVDMYCINGYGRDPNKAWDLESEIKPTNKWLDRLESIGAKYHHYIAGNHEYRLENYTMTHAPALYNTVRLERLLRLKSRGWSYTPYKQHLKIGKLYVTHDTGNAGANAHVQARTAFEYNVVIGHTHRCGIHYAGNAQGVQHVGAMFGWLGDKDSAAYMHDVNKRYWTLGIGIGYMEPNGNIHLQAIPFLGYSACVHGQMIR
jgi:predicted phosphodiesterase